jgi:hypothetical protein
VGLVSWIFNQLLIRKLKRDSEFLSAVKDSDQAAANLRATIRKLEAKGGIVPDSLKKYAGMKVNKKEN